MKNNNDNKLKLIKDFINEINNGIIISKNKAGNEFRKLKRTVTNDILRQDIIKDLERYLFGEDLENIELDDQSPPEDYAAETDEYLKYLEEQEKDRKKFSNEDDSSGSGLNKKGK